MRYDGSKRKLDESFQRENQNTADGEQLKKLDLAEHPENVMKAAKVVQLIKKYNFTFGIVSTPFDSRVTVIKGGPDETGYGGGGGGAG
jgi:hypothetical protein